MPFALKTFRINFTIGRYDSQAVTIPLESEKLNQKKILKRGIHEELTESLSISRYDVVARSGVGVCSGVSLSSDEDTFGVSS
nr:hypothetical protein Iba_chr12dCG10040 [Ipomoea batatas]